MSTEIHKYGLAELCAEYGSIDDIIADYGHDSCVPAICTECGATFEYEPDCADGFCDVCNRNTVQSAWILMGVI